MKLRPAVMGTSGPSGFWLMDENEITRFAISVTKVGTGLTKTHADLIASSIAEFIPEEGIELPE